MELDHLFLFTAVATAVLVLARSFQLHDARVRLAALAVLVISGIAFGPLSRTQTWRGLLARGGRVTLS